MKPEQTEKVIFPPEYYMRLALREAEKAVSAGEVPVGAVVVWQKRVIARAHNQVELLKTALPTRR